MAVPPPGQRLPAHSAGRLPVLLRPVIILASAWLVCELLIFRDDSFAQARLYVGIMIGIGIIYLAYLLIRRGVHGLTMPHMTDVDKTLATDADITDRIRH